MFTLEKHLADMYNAVDRSELEDRVTLALLERAKGSLEDSETSQEARALSMYLRDADLSAPGGLGLSKRDMSVAKGRLIARLGGVPRDAQQQCPASGEGSRQRRSFHNAESGMNDSGG